MATDRSHPEIRDELLDELLKNYKTPEDLTGKDGLLKQLTARLVERALDGELTHHLGYERYEGKGRKSGNSRNGATSKTLKSDQGDITIEVPRDRVGDFEPTLIKKHQRRFSGFDDKIVSMYSRGMTTRDIQSHLKEMYGTEVSPEFISSVTDSVMDEVREWQNRPLSRVYPIIYLDALIVKVRDDGRVTNKAAYLAIGIDLDGGKDIIFGNVEPAAFQIGPPERVYELCRVAIEKGKKTQSGFILGPGCGLPPTAPPANVYAMTKAVNDLGWYE